MEPISFGFEPDKPTDLPEVPGFFDLDAEIRKLVESTENYKGEVIELETTYATKHNEILAKIEKLRLQLQENHDKKYEALRKARDQLR